MKRIIQCLPIPRRKQLVQNKGVGTYCFILLMGLLALPLLLDKAIAHTKGYVGSQLWLYKPWCGATAITFTAEKFCENFINEDNFNNTFFVKVIQNHRCGTRTHANLAKRCDIIRQFGIRKLSKKLVIWDVFCIFICNFQLLIKFYTRIHSWLPTTKL